MVSIMSVLFQLDVGMLRAIAVVVSVVGVILLAILVTRWLPVSDSQSVTDQPTCDLLAGPCEWKMAGGLWQAQLKVVEEEGQETRYRFILEAPEAPERLLAVLQGESMYMGEYPVPLKRSEDGQYSAQFTAPLCTTGSDMVWRVDLQKGQKPLSEPVPRKLVFQALH